MYLPLNYGDFPAKLHVRSWGVETRYYKSQSTLHRSTPHTPGVVGWEGTKVAIVERQALWRETKARDLGVGFKRPVDSGESRG